MKLFHCEVFAKVLFGNPSPRNDVTIIKKTDRDHSRRMLLSVDLIMSAYTDTKSSMN